MIRFTVVMFMGKISYHNIKTSKNFFKLNPNTYIFSFVCIRSICIHPRIKKPPKGLFDSDFTLSGNQTLRTSRSTLHQVLRRNLTQSSLNTSLLLNRLWCSYKKLRQPPSSTQANSLSLFPHRLNHIPLNHLLSQ